MSIELPPAKEVVVVVSAAVVGVLGRYINFGASITAAHLNALQAEQQTFFGIA